MALTFLRYSWPLIRDGELLRSRSGGFGAEGGNQAGGRFIARGQLQLAGGFGEQPGGEWHELGGRVFERQERRRHRCGVAAGHRASDGGGWPGRIHLREGAASELQVTGGKRWGQPQPSANLRRQGEERNHPTRGEGGGEVIEPPCRRWNQHTAAPPGVEQAPGECQGRRITFEPKDHSRRDGRFSSRRGKALSG